MDDLILSAKRLSTRPLTHPHGIETSTATIFFETQSSVEMRQFFPFLYRQTQNGSGKTLTLEITGPR